MKTSLSGDILELIQHERPRDTHRQGGAAAAWPLVLSSSRVPNRGECIPMARILKLGLVLAVGWSLAGCGGEAAPPSEEEKAELNQKMDEDMKKMTLPKNPGAPQRPPR
jgi:hypothetical protein